MILIDEMLLYYILLCMVIVHHGLNVLNSLTYQAKFRFVASYSKSYVEVLTQLGKKLFFNEI